MNDNAAGQGPLERHARPLVARLRMHADNKTKRAMQLDCEQAADEIERLSVALETANAQAERFERGWYLRGDVLEKLQQWAAAYPLKVFPEPMREEWQRAGALLSEKGLSLDRICASNTRHVISGVRELADEGLKA